MYVHSELKCKKTETETENRLVQRNCLVIFYQSPFFSRLWSLRGAQHMDDYYTITAAAAPVVWQEDTSGPGCSAPPPIPYHSFQTGMPIFRVLLSAVMAVGSLASFNPSLPPASWLAEGMPLRSNPLISWHRPTIPSQILRGVSGVGGVSGRKEKVYPTQRELPLGAWGSRLQMKDKTQDDDNDDVWLFWGSVSGLTVLWQHFSLSSRDWQAGQWQWRSVSGWPPWPFPLRNLTICWANCHENLSSTLMLRRGWAVSVLDTLWTFLQCPKLYMQNITN